MTKRIINFDDIIDNSLKSEADKVSVPPKELIWEKISKQLTKEREIEQKRELKVKAVVASIVLILSFGVVPWALPGRDANAVGRRLVQIFHRVFQDDTRIDTISRENPPPDASPPPKEEASVEVHEMPKPVVFLSIDEARKNVPFFFKVPNYIPEGYQLEDITLSGFEKETGELAFRYKSLKGEFFINERNLPDDFAMSSNVRTEEAIIEEVDINDDKGTLILFRNGFNEVQFYSMGISIRVYGIIDAEEILKICKSLK